jgi:hypothetical protein
MRRRRILSGTDAVVSAVLALALLGILNFLAARYDRTFDWTGKKLHTLDSRTTNILTDIQGKQTRVRIAAFFAPQYEWHMDLRTRVKALLDRYKAVCPSLEVQILDVYSDPKRAEAVAKDMLGGPVEPNSVVFRCGDQHKSVTSADMAVPDFPDRVKEFKGEDVFSSALRSVLVGKTPRILCVSGHGERTLDEEKDRGEGLSFLKGVLDRAGLPLKSEPLGTGPLEGRWDLVIVAGPTSRYLPEETERLHQYLLAGGRLLLLLDPLLGQGNKGLEPTGLEALVARWGVTALDELVIDRKRCLPDQEGRPQTHLFGTVGFSAESPITRGMGAETPMLFGAARPVEAASEGAPPGLRLATLVRSEDSSWAKADLRDLVRGALMPEPKLDRRGPHGLGVQVEVHPEDIPPPAAEAKPGPTALPSGTKPGGRAVVFGDADIASSHILSQFQPNRDVVVNAVYWLLDRQESMGISGKSDVVKINLDPKDLRQLRDTVLTVPVAFLILGVLVWWVRRH